jgi:hypothetical protein
VADLYSGVVHHSALDEAGSSNPIFREGTLAYCDGHFGPDRGVVGVLVLIRVILLSLNEPKRAMNWAMAGVVAGSITLALIVVMYHSND